MSSKANLNFKIAITGIFSALAVIFTVTPIGYITIGVVGLTIVHIPVILAAILGGPVAGICTGFIFGITSLIKAGVVPQGLNPLFFNPLISVFPRVLFSIAVYGIFKLLDMIPKMPKFISASIAAAAGTLIHTFLVMLMLVVVHSEEVLLAFGLDPANGIVNGFWSVLGLALLSNGIYEIIAATVVTFIVMSSIYISKKKSSKISMLAQNAENEADDADAVDTEVSDADIKVSDSDIE